MTRGTATKHEHRARRSHWRSPLLAGVVLTALVTGCSSQGNARGFKSPDEAVQTLTKVVRAGDTPQVLSIIGPEGEDIISSGDEVADRQRRERFLELYDQKHLLVPEAEDRQTLVVGNDGKAGSTVTLNARLDEAKNYNVTVYASDMTTVIACGDLDD